MQHGVAIQDCFWPIPADTTGGSRLVPAYYYRQSSVPKLPVATGRA